MRFAFSALATATLASCGPASLAPRGATQPGFSAASDFAGRSARARDCGLAEQPLPGKYAILRVDGQLAFKKFVGSGVWEYGTVTPSAEPAPTSEPSPPPTAVYVYVGRYHLTKFHQDGCAYLITTQSGKAIDGANNGMFDGAPRFAHESFTIAATSGGRLRVDLEMTEKGGTGTLALSDGSTGTVRFDRREVESDGITEAMHPDFSFSCDPTAYQYKTLQTAKPGTSRGFGFTPKNPGADYRLRFSFCTTENSYLTANEVTSTQSYAFSHGALDYRLTGTFSTGVDWAHRPDVVVWEEAYRFDGTRDNLSDILLALVRVR
ncbi:MAG TPA: hypothetical protein VGG89_13980 [Candidatus Baltobacteraceae bacterium]|jgi:hypothetical protein